MISRWGSNFYYLTVHHSWALLDQLDQLVSLQARRRTTEWAVRGHFEAEAPKAGSAVPEPSVCDGPGRTNSQVPDFFATASPSSWGGRHHLPTEEEGGLVPKITPQRKPLPQSEVK